MASPLDYLFGPGFGGPMRNPGPFTPGINPNAPDPYEYLRQLASGSGFGGGPVGPTPPPPLSTPITPSAPQTGLKGLLGKIGTGMQSPLGQFGMNLLAQSGPSLMPQSTLSNIGQAGLRTQAGLQAQDMNALQKKLIESQIGRNQALGAQGANPTAGNVQSTFQGSNGNMWLVTRSGEVKDTGVKFNESLKLITKPDGSIVLVDDSREALQDPKEVVSSEEAIDQAANLKSAETTAAKTAESDVAQDTVARQNQQVLQTWEVAREGLMRGLEGTQTGPIAGRIPAVTTGQQVAEGGIAAVAPILKQLFRTAGEGIFTDKDQQLLLDMVPKRTDTEEAVQEKMANIDAIIKAKLTAPQGDSNVIDFNDLP